MTCKYCGQVLSAGTRRCSCGHLTDSAFRNDYTAAFSPADIGKHRSVSALSYFGPLLLIPAFFTRRSQYARFHVNQGLALFIVELTYTLATRIITRILDLALGTELSSIPTTLSTIFSFASLLFLVLAVLGAINAVVGKAKDLPLVGRIRFLK